MTRQYKTLMNKIRQDQTRQAKSIQYKTRQDNIIQAKLRQKPRQANIRQYQAI